MSTKHRTLEAGDKILKGDEAKWPDVPDTWVTPYVISIGTALDKTKGVPVRRPIKSRPKKAYRILKPNEEVRERDQGYDTTTRGWFYPKTHVFIGKTVSSVTHPFYVSRFRREVKV